jgi:hypothetical protein
MQSACTDNLKKYNIGNHIKIGKDGTKYKLKAGTIFQNSPHKIVDKLSSRTSSFYNITIFMGESWKYSILSDKEQIDSRKVEINMEY